MLFVHQKLIVTNRYGSGKKLGVCCTDAHLSALKLLLINNAKRLRKISHGGCGGRFYQQTCLRHGLLLIIRCVQVRIASGTKIYRRNKINYKVCRKYTVLPYPNGDINRCYLVNTTQYTMTTALKPIAPYCRRLILWGNRR